MTQVHPKQASDAVVPIPCMGPSVRTKRRLLSNISEGTNLPMTRLLLYRKTTSLFSGLVLPSSMPPEEPPEEGFFSSLLEGRNDSTKLTRLGMHLVDPQRLYPEDANKQNELH